MAQFQSSGAFEPGPDLVSGGLFTAGERLALTGLATNMRKFAAREILDGHADSRGFAVLVIEGFLARRKLTGEGRRQLTAIFVPGDLIDGHARLTPPADHELVALSDGCAALIPEHRLGVEAGQGLASALRRCAAYEAAITREWVVNIGARSAGPRVAHLLCELMWRLRHAGLVDDHSCNLALRQQDIADASGLSAVHVNRVLQRLRRANLIRFSDERLEILDGRRLEDFADFHSEYLEAAGVPSE